MSLMYLGDTVENLNLCLTTPNSFYSTSVYLPFQDSQGLPHLGSLHGPSPPHFPPLQLAGWLSSVLPQSPVLTEAQHQMPPFSAGPVIASSVPSPEPGAQ